MIEELNPLLLEDIDLIYKDEFDNLLNKIVLCYKMMIEANIKLPNDENKIRDVLVISYLRNDKIRNIIGLKSFLFNKEVPEDKTNGRTDIKIETKNTFEKQEAYYIIECKRLDNENLSGDTGLNAKYINDGIMRFVTIKYSSFHRINGMIGFIVQKMDINKNISNINSLLEKNKETNTEQVLKRDNFINNFDYSYTSKHIDKNKLSFVLYHLMFDYSCNIEVV